MKVALQPKAWRRRWFPSDAQDRWPIPVTQSLPFVHSQHTRHGVAIVHRIRHAQITRYMPPPRLAFNCWCGQALYPTSHVGPPKILAAVPDRYPACTMCEQLARAAGEKSASELMGRNPALWSTPRGRASVYLNGGVV